MQRIVIFGANSAIAAACARQWVARGERLFVVGRDAGKLEVLLADLRVRGGGEVFGGCADLCDATRHAELLAQAEAALGGIDVVLIAHGVLPEQKACEKSYAATLAVLDANGLSVISLLTLAANKMESQGKGVLAVISSVAGDRGRQSNYVYGAAKAMVTAFLQGLRNRLARKGVAVVTIKPGFVDTPMAAKIPGKRGVLWAQPEDVAKGIILAIDRRGDVVYLPWFWRWIMLVVRHIPEAVFKRLST